MTIGVEEFTARAREFLDASAEPAPDRATHWGEGSDDVGLFDNTADHAGSPAVLAARTWQATKFAAGYGWLTGPSDLGGADLPIEHDVAFSRLEDRYAIPDPTILSVGLHMVRPTVARWAQPGVREEVGRGLASADVVGCQLFSEPEADLAGIRTTARRDGDGWVVDGQKIWTSHGHLSDIGLLLARSDPAGARYRNLTMFLVDMTAPGVDARPIRQATGAVGFSEVFFDGVRIPDSHRLGPVGEGWQVAVSTLMNERLSIGSGRSNRTVDLALLMELVRRHGDGSALTRDLAARAYTAQRLSERFAASCAEEVLDGGSPGPRFSIGKVLLVESLNRTAELVDHVLGGRSVADTTEWGTYAWHLVGLEIPAYSVGGGSDEIQRNIVAERVLGLPKS